MAFVSFFRQMPESYLRLHHNCVLSYSFQIHYSLIALFLMLCSLGCWKHCWINWQGLLNSVIFSRATAVLRPAMLPWKVIVIPELVKGDAEQRLSAVTWTVGKEALVCNMFSLDSCTVWPEAWTGEMFNSAYCCHFCVRGREAVTCADWYRLLSGWPCIAVGAYCPVEMVSWDNLMAMHVHQVHIMTYYCLFHNGYSVMQDGAKAHTVIAWRIWP